MFGGFSSGEVFVWVVCLALAIGLIVSGSAYLVASAFMSADVSDVIPQGGHSRTPWGAAVVVVVGRFQGVRLEVVRGYCGRRRTASRRPWSSVQEIAAV
jgi:hypothetical protein